MAVIIPFEHAMAKTSTQIRALIEESRGIALPKSVRYTGGLYDRKGAAYILFSEHPLDDRPSKTEIMTDVSGKFSRRLGVGLQDVKWDQERLRLTARLTTPRHRKDWGGHILIQMTKAGTSQMAFFAKRDGPPFDVEAIFGSVTVAPDQRLTWEDLSWGLPPQIQYVLAGLLVLVALTWWLLKYRRSRRW